MWPGLSPSLPSQHTSHVIHSGVLASFGTCHVRGWDGWMASPTQWTWVWVDSGSWWWTGRPGVLRFIGLQRVRHDWVTELTDWLTDWYTLVLLYLCSCCFLYLKCHFSEKEMATHSSILAWKNPRTEESGRLKSMGLHDWACVHEGGGRWVGSNKLVKLKKKMSLFTPYPSLFLLSATIMILLLSLEPNSTTFSVRLCCLPCLNNCTVCGSSFFLLYLKILTVLGLHCGAQAFSSCRAWALEWEGSVAAVKG